MSLDEQIAKIQRDQHGLITMEQLLGVGCSYKAARRRRRSGLLVQLHRGVFASPSSVICTERDALAAVLAAGATAFASHETGVYLWESPLTASPAIEVTTVLERQPRLSGVRMHRSGLLKDLDVTEVRGIPVATPERTIVDLSSRLSELELGRLIDDALRRGITTLYRIHAVLERLPQAPGRSPTKLRKVLDLRIPGIEERESALEDFVFDSLRRFALPLPVAQHPVELRGVRRRIDLAYPPKLLALEAKGFEYHSGRGRFDDDAVRGNELRLAGWTVLEFTSAFTDWQIAEQVARALGRPVPPRPAQPLTFQEWNRLR